MFDLKLALTSAFIMFLLEYYILLRLYKRDSTLEKISLIAAPTMIIVALYIYKVLDLSDVILVIKGTVLCSLIKYLFKRIRPYHASDKIKNYSGKEHKFVSDKYSFPSGHTFAATFLSLVMLNKYPSEFIFNIISILVGFSRVFLGVHYPTDIIGGMLFGFIFYKILN